MISFHFSTTQWLIPAKLQTEVRRLQESLEGKRLSRLESSENILQDARLRIQSFRDLVLDILIIFFCLHFLNLITATWSYGKGRTGRVDQRSGIFSQRQ